MLQASADAERLLSERRGKGVRFHADRMTEVKDPTGTFSTGADIARWLSLQPATGILVFGAISGRGRGS